MPPSCIILNTIFAHGDLNFSSSVVVPAILRTAAILRIPAPREVQNIFEGILLRGDEIPINGKRKEVSFMIKS